MRDTLTTRLGRVTARLQAAHPGHTGIYALPEPRAAFAARAILAAAADRTLDVQYYIWRADETGWLLFQALWAAAERGVRVRLLLDDNNTGGLDPTLAALDTHPNIDVRLYNALSRRRLRVLNYLTDFRRLNRRMHNKSFTVDDAVTIVGGRNVGNEYFARGGGVGFRDLDVIALGAVVPQVTSSFERYWTSPSARPVTSLVRPAGPEAVAALRTTFERVRADPTSRTYLESLRETGLVQALLEGDPPLEWCRARLLSDDPAKTLDPGGNTDILLFPALLDAAGAPARSFDLVSPYLVPGERGTGLLTSLAKRGVKVRILTNSLAATDVVAVHAGYARRRPDLLRAGVRLFELKPSALGDDPRGKGTVGSSTASLHAKTFCLDRSLVFVGSFNFDQRSALLNTEMGLLMESPALAERLATRLDEELPDLAYEVRSANEGRGLEWVEATPAGPRSYAAEPGSGWVGRAVVRLMCLLPIEWLL